MTHTAWQTRAKNSEEAFGVLDPFAIVSPGDPFYADIEADLPREHYGVSANLERHFRNVQTQRRWQHVGIIGHKGTGKTTLVRKTMARLSSRGVMAVPINAQLVLDQGGFRFSDMMLVIARAVLGAMLERGVGLDEKLIEVVRQWFAEELLEESHATQIQGSVETSVGAENKLALLTAFSAKVTAALKSTNERRKIIRERAERDLADLVRRVNLLLDGAHQALQASKQQLCVVFDNLEKIDDRKIIDEAVLRRADDFRSLRCHLLLFFSPADQYSPRTIQAGQAFPLVTVPVLPVRERGDEPLVVRPEAKRALTRLLDARMMLDEVFEDADACIQRLAQLSGGHVRDLFALARRACEIAEPNKVTVDDIERGATRLASERLILLRPEDWPRAAEIAESHRVENRKEDSHLILHSCVLNYDGEPWWDVHPFLRGDERLHGQSG